MSKKNKNPKLRCGENPKKSKIRIKGDRPKPAESGVSSETKLKKKKTHVGFFCYRPPAESGNRLRGLTLKNGKSFFGC